MLLGSLLAALPLLAQSQLLIEPSQAPITLKGRWEAKRGVAGGGGSSGQIVLKISKVNPDGTFEGRLDFGAGERGLCKANNEPIVEGRITSNSIKVVASGGPPSTCGMLTLDFKPGKEKWLEGRIKSETGGRGAPMWLDAPK
jgi:hypothetical protein